MNHLIISANLRIDNLGFEESIQSLHPFQKIEVSHLGMLGNKAPSRIFNLSSHVIERNKWTPRDLRNKIMSPIAWISYM